MKNISPGQPYQLLHGHRQAGKTTVLLFLYSILPKHGFTPVFFDVQACSPSTFWSKFSIALRNAVPWLLDFNDREGFERSCSWRTYDSAQRSTLLPIIILFDELDVLLSPLFSGILSEFLPSLRSVKTAPPKTFLVQSVIGAGVFRITDLATSGLPGLSPFNTAEYHMVPHFSQTEVAQLLLDFSIEHNVIIDEKVMYDIFNLTNGHPGLVGILGHMIERLICNKYVLQTSHFFSLGEWMELFSSKESRALISDSCDSMLKSMKDLPKGVYDKVCDSLKSLLFNDFVSLPDKEVFNWLFSEGFVMPAHSSASNLSVVFTSAMHRCIIMQFMSPSPGRGVMKPTSPDLIAACVRSFDTRLLINPHSHLSSGRVSEYAYQAALYTALLSQLDTTYIPVPEARDSHMGTRRVDFLITNSDVHLIECGQNMNRASTEEHVFRTRDIYVPALHAVTALVLNFICSEEAPELSSLVFPPGDIKVVHVWHNPSFNQVSMYEDGSIRLLIG